MNKKSILLVGYDSNLCLGVIYCLKALDYSLYLLTSNRKNAARYSNFISGTFYYQQSDDVVNQIISIVNDNNIDLIMPVDELEIRFVRHHQDVLSQHAVCTWATETAMFDIGINKGLLAQFLTLHNIPCPISATAETISELERVANEMQYPVLVKPTRSSFGRGIQRFENWDDLKSFYEQSDPKSKEFILQPFIIGSDITCNVICKEGEVLCHTIQESPVKDGSDFSSNDILDFHNDAEVLSIVTKMMKLLKWSGIACVDIRRDHRNQAVYILEINGRFWASVVASYVKAGINFPMITVKLALGEEVVIPRQKPANQSSIKKYIHQKLSGKSVSVNDTKYGSYMADPMARMAQILKI